MKEPQIKPEEDVQVLSEEEAVDALTAYFQRTGRGRIADLPRWAQ